MAGQLEGPRWRLLLMVIISTLFFYSLVVGLLPGKPQLQAFREPPAAANKINKTRNMGRWSVVSEKWIVVTTINYPTDSVRKLANISGWQMVVVGDVKTPVDWHLEGTVFLDLQAQTDLGYEICKLLPLRHYARKNIGYLYAVQHGAKTIYETDDDNYLVMQTIGEAFDLRPFPVTDMLSYIDNDNASQRLVVNPYIHFGQSSMWPRGFPLGAIEENNREVSYATSFHSFPFIQQGLANGDPDVDAIFRLTRRSKPNPIRVKFDSLAPPVSIPRGLLAPFNSQNTLFHREALWAMMIPTTTTFRVCDIWRGYWAQRLLWDIGGQLSFFAPSVYQDRNVHDYMADFVDEAGMYQNTSRLVEFLVKWKPEGKSFFDNVVQLTTDMATQEFWGFEEVLLVKAWLKDLVSVGYLPPEFRSSSLDGAPKATRVMFSPSEMESSYLHLQVGLRGGVVSMHGAPTQPGQMLIFDDDGDDAMTQLKRLRTYFKDIVLIVNYNWPHHQSVLFWRQVYERIFSKVVFISTEESKELEIEQVACCKGFLMYEALPRLFKRFPWAAGFLLINDDVVLNYWNLVGANKSKIWTTYDHPNFLQYGNNDKPINEYAWHDLKENQDTVLKASSNVPAHYQHNLHLAGLNSSGFVYQLVDVFYVPQRLTQGFAELVPFYLDLQVRGEAAVPMILAMLEPSSTYSDVLRSGVSLWGETRSNPEIIYKTNIPFYHGWKPKSQEDMVKIRSCLKKGDLLL